MPAPAAEPGRPYRGQSMEARRADRRARLCDAALALLGDGESPTVRAICRGASLTPRYFYEEFGDLDGALRALVDREFDAGVLAVMTALNGAGPAAGNVIRLEAAVSAVLGFVEAQPGRAAMLTGGGVLAEQRAQRMTDLIAILADLGAEAYPPTSATTAERDARRRAAATFSAGGLIASIEAWLAGDLTRSRQSLTADLVAQLQAVGDVMSQPRTSGAP